MNTRQPVTQKKDRRAVLVVDHRVKSSSLFVGCKELTIIHNNEEYRLHLTGKGKLILTK